MVAGTKDKLVRTKQQWAHDGRLLTGKAGDRRLDRLPPGQRLVENWPVLDLGVQPDVPRCDWRLAIDGCVEAPVTLDWEAFAGLPQTEMVSDIHCVTQWSRYDNRWTGVAAATLIALVRPLAEASHVLLQGYDGYTTNVSLEAFAAEDVLVAHSWQGEAIGREHGGPARLVIPAFYFWKSPKWLKRIEFAAADRPGFWEVRGYHNIGDPWAEQRYAGS